MSTGKLSLEDAQLLAAQISGRLPAGNPAVDPSNPWPIVWHGSAVAVFILGIAGGVVMIRRGFQTAGRDFHWNNPSSWSTAGLFSKIF